MKLTLKIVVALTVLMAAGVVYAEIPDVSKWACPAGVINVNGTNPDYGLETMACDGDEPRSFYVKVSGELFYIHEHRTDGGKTVYYNALKTDNGSWIEVVNRNDRSYKYRYAENGNDIIVSITDDNRVVVAERLVPLLKK